jgi:uncharacterized protein (TIGR02217 family)
MGFDEVQFPVDISYGSKGGPGFRTDIIISDSGMEERIARWSNARRKYNVAYGIKSPEQVQSVMDFYLARMGAANGFRYKDFTDFTTASDHRSAHANDDVLLGTGNGTTTTFQLKKLYTSGAITRTRNITKPVTGTTLVALDGVNQTSGWSVDTSTGIVTFSVAPTLGVAVTAGCQFDVPVRFGQEVDDALWLTIDAFSIRSIPDIPLVEIVDSLTVYDQHFYGGAYEKAISADHQMTLADGRVQVFNPGATTGLSVKLPDPTNIAPGGPIFFILNEGAATFALKQFDGTLVANIPSTGVLLVFLSTTNNVNKVWYGI